MKTPRSSSSLVLLVCFLACVLMPLPSQAAVIFGNMSSTNDSNSLVASLFGGGFQTGMIFTTGSQEYTVDSVILRLGNYNTSTDVAQVGFFLDDGSGTNTGAQVGNFLIAPSSASSSVANFTFLPDGPLTLAASTTYWLLVDGAAAAYDWFGNSPPISPTGSGAVFNSPYLHSSNNGVSYATTNLKPSFQINGTATPEPSRALLLVLGLGALIVRRRRSM